jgi:hypothetical protein
MLQRLASGKAAAKRNGHGMAISTDETAVDWYQT